MIRLGRAWWHAERGDIAAAIIDTRRALDPLHTDPPRQAEARTLLQTMRHADPDRFDRAWDDTDGEKPRWLHHLRYDNDRRALIRAWYTCTLDEAERFLEEHPATLLTDETLATLDRLIDADPDNAGLQLNRDIIRAARARGVTTAYTEHRDRLWRDDVHAALDTWFDASTEHESSALSRAITEWTTTDTNPRRARAMQTTSRSGGCTGGAGKLCAHVGGRPCHGR
ncbi:MAG: hypothetical protein ACRDST_13055, partial [Pseudonocardiaceae bacterium]